MQYDMYDSKYHISSSIAPFCPSENRHAASRTFSVPNEVTKRTAKEPPYILLIRIKVFSLFPSIHTMASIARLQPSILPQPCLYSAIRTSSRSSSRQLVSRPIRPSQLAAISSSRGITRTFTGSAAGDCIPIYLCHQQLRS